MASCTGYKRRRPPALDPSPHSGSGNPVITNCHMPEAQLSDSRKRQRSEQLPLQLNGTSQPLSKKRRLSHPSGSQPAAAFWDNLSKIWLTKRALRELDRRNTQSAPSPPRPSYQRRPHRPVTRRALAELKNNCRPTQSAADFLCHCAPRCLKDIKRFARHGGPDLSDLRGVCNCKIPAGARADCFLSST